MDMVWAAANAFRDHSILLSDNAHVRPKAFSNISIQDPNTFLCAEDAMNVQARESVCLEGNCIVGQIIQLKIFQFRIRNFHRSNHRFGAQVCTNHTVPYGTALLGWRCPRHFVPGYDRTVLRDEKPDEGRLNDPPPPDPRNVSRFALVVFFAKLPNLVTVAPSRGATPLASMVFGDVVEI